MGVVLELLEHGHLPGDHHLAPLSLPGRRCIGLVGDLEHLERDPEVGIGVVVDVRPGDVGLALVPVQAVDVVLDPLVDVDRLLVDEERGGEEVDLTQDPVAIAGGIDDDHVLRRARAQAEVAGREVLVAPVVAIVVRAADPAVLLQDVEQRRCLLDAEPLGGRDRQLEGRCTQVVQQDVQVVGVHQPVLRRAVEEVLRVGGEELVDRRRRADERREARACAPSGTSHLLPRAGDGAGIADADRCVQAADVDPELERVRGHHAPDAPVAQASLDRVAFVRQVAAAVATDRVRLARRRLERFAQVAGQHLDRRA